MRSIRRVLLAALIGVTTLVMLVAAAFSYLAGLQEAGEMFDAKLAHSARVLASLVDEPLADLADHPGAPLVIDVWHGEAHGVGSALAFPTGHAYETKLAFQVRDSDGRLLLRSDSGPVDPLGPLVPGYADVDLGGERWRVFTLHTPAGRWYQAGEQAGIRAELAEDVAFGTLLPLLIALPLLALTVWLAVGWAGRSLERVSAAVAERAPEHLAPIRLERVPREIEGIVRAVNGLLGRLEAALARERRFTADAAHELRTPLAALKVHAYNLRQTPVAAEREEAQAHLDASIRRMERLVAQLLALSRLESGAAPAHVAVDLAAVVERHRADAIALGAARGLRIAFRVHTPVSVSGDERSLDALVGNLIDNALRYAPSGGAVVVSLEAADGEARLVVEDAGPGIPAAARQRVFERFHRELGTGVEGSGLGLAIVAQALALHGGRITLDDSPALGGLRATVRLPSA